MLRAALAGAARGPGHIRLVAVPVLIALAALIWLEPRLYSRVQAAWFDSYQRLSPRQVLSMPATIVEIDQKSLAAIGQWPWPRSLLTRLIDGINRHQPAAIGIDILMPEADELSPERLLARARSEDPALATRIAAMETNDAILARALRAAPTVLAVVGSEKATGMLLRAAPFVVSDADAQSGSTAPFTTKLAHYAGVLTSIDQLDRAASGRGLISVEPAFGSIGRIPLVASIDGTLVPTLAIEMLRVAVGARSLRLLASGADVEGVGVGSFVAPTEGDGAVRVYYSPHNADRFVSAIDLMDGKFDPAQFRQKLVLVGVTGVGLIEDKNTPLGMVMPGVEIHAQLLENLYDQTLLRRPGWAPRLEAFAFLLFGSMLVFATPRWKPRNAAMLALGGVALLTACGYLIFRSQRLLFDAASPGFCVVVLFGVLLVLTLTEATRQKKSLERVVQAQREESARIAGELDAAKRIQAATLPRADLLRGDARIDLAAVMLSAREVGGDLYDYFRLDDRRLFFLVGDVAGKGLSASIFMAVSKALYKSTTLRKSGADIGEIMSTANAEVSRDNAEMLFVTAFAGILDLESGDLAYCNAGHENPWLVHPSEGSARRIDDGDGPPLCTVDDFSYHGGRCRMRRGDRLCLISDGVSEARNPAGELYGGERVERLLLDLRGSARDAAAVVDALRKDVESFAAGAEPADDLTVLVLRWNGPAVAASVAFG